MTELIKFHATYRAFKCVFGGTHMKTWCEGMR